MRYDEIIEIAYPQPVYVLLHGGVTVTARMPRVDEHRLAVGELYHAGVRVPAVDKMHAQRTRYRRAVIRFDRVYRYRESDCRRREKQRGYDDHDRDIPRYGRKSVFHITSVSVVCRPAPRLTRSGRRSATPSL